jgi:hypothetical protein
VNLKTLTISDSEALAMMPSGWFTLWNVPSSLNRPAYRIERLVKAGVIESRVNGRYPDHVIEYHVKANAGAGQ